MFKGLIKPPTLTLSKVSDKTVLSNWQIEIATVLPNFGESFRGAQGPLKG
jgi:hypothetical protein